MLLMRTEKRWVRITWNIGITRKASQPACLINEKLFSCAESKNTDSRPGFTLPTVPHLSTTNPPIHFCIQLSIQGFIFICSRREYIKYLWFKHFIFYDLVRFWIMCIHVCLQWKETGIHTINAIERPEGVGFPPEMELQAVMCSMCRY